MTNLPNRLKQIRAELGFSSTDQIANEQKNKGVAVIFVGEDLDVLLALCDDILVLGEGKVRGIVDARNSSKEEVGIMMTKSNYVDEDKMPVDLEELGRLALVAGANVFIIGEAKGPEICSAITLSNSGCRSAITIHSPSSTETIDKMADLALRGYAQDYVQAKRMIKSFQTIFYMQDFKVQEISEIIGYDEEKKDMIYRYIYKRPNTDK